MSENRSSEYFSGFSKIIHIGFTIAGSILAFTYIGIIIDNKFDTNVLFTVIGFIWGITGSNLYIYFKYLRTIPEKKFN